MAIALKALKIHKGLSEETYCYTATVLVDGIPAFHASNHGHGGCDNYQPVPGYKGPSELEISAWLKANKEPCISHGMSLEYDLELMVGELLEHHERTATLARMLRRSEEHTSELQSLMRISYAVFCLKKKNTCTKKRSKRTNKKTPQR